MNNLYCNKVATNSTLFLKHCKLTYKSLSKDDILNLLYILHEK